jgi:hypothetical protein
MFHQVKEKIHYLWREVDQDGTWAPPIRTAPHPTTPSTPSTPIKLAVPPAGPPLRRRVRG